MIVKMTLVIVMVGRSFHVHLAVLTNGLMMTIVTMHVIIKSVNGTMGIVMKIHPIPMMYALMDAVRVGLMMVTATMSAILMIATMMKRTAQYLAIVNNNYNFLITPCFLF